MRIFSAALVLAACRVAMLAGHEIAWSWWSPIAYAWQDAAVLLAYAAFDRGLRRQPRVAMLVYAAFIGYLAFSVPVTRVMSTPMTWPMWRGAGGALGDSVRVYATAANFTWVIGVLAIGAAVFARRTARPAALLVICAAIAVAGPFAVPRVDTRGLERNAWSALAVGALPRVKAEAAHADWRAPRFNFPADRSAERAVDLSRFAGAAGGHNVVLVSLESTAAQYLGLYGAVPDVMPNLSELAEHAVVFDNAYAVYPESIKGLFSILCSTYPAIDRAAQTLATAPCPSIAATLSGAGYHTALFHSGRFDYLGMNSVIRNRGFDVLADAGDIGGNHESSFGVDDRTTAARLLEWIDSRGGGAPFFAAYLPIAGHHPYEVPESTGPASTEIARYRNALRYSDDVLGDLVRGIDARGLARKTVWIVVGDHGEAFGQHDGNFGHTFQLFEENVRVPFFVAAPGVIPQRIRNGAVVSLLDAAPTIVDLLGLRSSELYQGRSALDATPRMALFFADYSLGLLGLRDGRFKYIYEIESGRSRLFDVVADVQESQNLAGAHAQDAAWYAERLLQWSAAQRARLP